MPGDFPILRKRHISAQYVAHFSKVAQMQHLYSGIN